jgi:hypothetical protein
MGIGAIAAKAPIGGRSQDCRGGYEAGPAVSTSYTPDQLESFAKQIENHKPPTPSRENYTAAPAVLRFACYGDSLGMVVRFRLDNGTIKNLEFNALVAAYAAAAIVDVAERLAWTLDGETLHPDAVPHGRENPDPHAEKRWARDWEKTKIVKPSAPARANSDNVISVNGEGSLDAFVIALALEEGDTVILRMSPLVAWELSGAVHDVGEREGWWNDLANVLAGKTIN